MRLFTRFFAVHLGLLLVAGTAFAQFDTDWERSDALETTPEWFGDATERSMAYGVVGGVERLYVPSRSGGAFTIRVIDPNTGDDVDDVVISTEGISGGVVAFNTIAVTDDGKILVSNLTTSAESSPLKIYMWEDEASDPEVVIEYAEGNIRFGDHLSVSGSVSDGTAVVYAAATTNNHVVRWGMEEDGDAYAFADSPEEFFDLPNIDNWGSPGWAVGLGPGLESGFLASGRSVTFPREYNREGATTGYIQWTSTDINQNVSSGVDVTIGDERFLATYHPGQRKAALFTVDNSTAPGVWTNRFDELYGTTPELGSIVENTFGDVAVRVNDDNSVTLFVLGTKNGIGAYTSDQLVTPPFEPIAFWHQNDNELSGGGFGFEEGSFPMPADVGAGWLNVGGGDILATDEDGVYTWIASHGGSSVNAPDGVASGGSISPLGGLEGVNNGAWIQFSTKTVGYEDVVLTYASRGTSSGFRDVQLSYSFDGVDFTDFGDSYDPYDNSGSSYQVYTYDFEDLLNHQDTVFVRLTLDGSTSDLGNNRFDNITLTGTEAEPPAPIDPPTLLDDPVWVIEAGEVPWFANDHATRGGDYNPATDNLLVPSRTGEPQIQILHPATGQPLGVLDLTDVSGGTYPINEISVTEDGQIFVANLAQAGQDLKVYRWANQEAVPELVYEGQPAENSRYGDALHASVDGDDVLVFVSGSLTDNIAMITLSDGDATVDIIELDVDMARAGIHRVPGQDSLWVNGSGTDLAKISYDGTVGRTVGTDVLSIAYGDIYHFRWQDRSYVLTGPQHQEDNRFLVVDVTDAGNERVVFETIGLGETDNTNAVGFATADWKRGNLIVGATNNAIAAFSLEERDNTPPLAGGIARPVDNATVTIEGDSDQVLEVIWRHGIDQEGDPVLHTYQLSTSNSFDVVAIEVATLSDTTTSVSYADIDAFLDDQGVQVGESLEVYHRVVVSDGELSTASAVSTLTLTRGSLTNVDPWSSLPTEFALQGNYPNPFNPTTNIRFDLPESADVRVEVYDVLGRQVMVLNADALQAGADQNIRVDASRFASGTYLYRIVAETANGVHEATGTMVLVK